MIKFFKHISPWIICILLLFVGRIPLQMLLGIELIGCWTISDIIGVVINNTEAKIASFLIVITLYIKGIETIKEEKTLINNRVINEISLILAIWIITPQYFQGYNLILQSTIEVTLIEVMVLIYKIGTQNVTSKKSKATFPFSCDLPTDDDLFDRKHYATILLDKILETKHSINPNKAFTIFLNERFGFGKTSFFLQLKKIINEDRRNEFIYIDYNPWLCENEDAITKEFFTLLKDKLSPYDIGMSKTIDDYVRNLGIAGNNWIRSILPNKNSLWNSEEKLSKYVREIDKPVVVFIDDVDRLSRDETLNLLKMIRNTADFGNVYYIVACDQQNVQQHLLKAGILDPEKYIKKFANYEFVLPANDKAMEYVIEQDLRICFEKISLSNEYVDEIIDKHVKPRDIIRIFEDLRDWKRCLNNITFNLDVLIEEETIRDVYIPDVVYLCILQTVNVDIYKILRDNDSVLLSVSQSDFSRLSLKPQLEGYCRDLNLSGLDENDNQKIQSINEFINIEVTGKEENTSYLLYRLFGDKYNWKNKLCICFVDSYFKYFSGKNRTNEIPMASVMSLLSTDSQDSFYAKLKEYELKYSQSLFHKLKHASEQKIENKTRRISLLKKFVTYLEHRAKLNENGNIDRTIYTECVDHKIGILFVNLFLTKTLHLGKSEWSIIRDYFEHEVRISTIISFVKIIISYNTYNFFLDKRLMDLMKIACTKYEKTYLDKNPFSVDSINIFFIFSEVRHEVWDNTLSEHIRSIKYPYPWLYLVVKPNESNWEINNKFRDALFSCVNPSLYSVLSERPDKDNAILQDFHEIVNGPLKSFVEEDHVFLQEARKWWNDNDYWLKQISF